MSVAPRARAAFSWRYSARPALGCRGPVRSRRRSRPWCQSAEREPAVDGAVDLGGVAHAQLGGGRVVDGSQAVHEAPRDAADAGVEGHLRHGEGLRARMRRRRRCRRWRRSRQAPRPSVTACHCPAAALARAPQRRASGGFRVQAVLVHLAAAFAQMAGHCRVGGAGCFIGPLSPTSALTRASAVAEHAGRVSRLHGILASSSLSPSYVCVRFAQLGKS